ncbi:hypothetical protein SAMN05444004_11278 [Jannaschia faecimaris]|uniref:Uncharacterized protein n=1 Tax=Jannaschia faecimaris TaxID=1244108 RepID=A0A1H3SKR3_9RHOB|nr:hypothetical protein [Jannaschia faecimaris]SDZ38268.1 hypothetical protein SAMN05444004_11278 [Jannaschia faecimaris]
MAFSDRFLSALNKWQKGWQEKACKRLEIANELESSIAETGLSQDFRNCDKTCYRKRFLVPNNPTNGGDLGPLFINGSLPEGVASWSSDKRFAQDFKDPTREGTFAAIFSHIPDPSEVLLNIPALWEDSSFQTAVKRFHDGNRENADALFRMRSRQSEVILRADLKYEELVHICGRSSPFDTLCELCGLHSEEEQDRLWSKFVEANSFPEEAFSLSTTATRAAMDRARASFLDKHGSTIQTVIAQRG